MTIKSLDDAPSHIRSILIDELTKYATEAGGLKSESQVKAAIHEYTGYSLKMFWLGRTDKLSSSSLPAFDWLTQNLVAPNLLEKYEAGKPQKVSFIGVDHTTLCQNVLDKTFELLKASQGIEFKIEPPPARSVLKFFGKK